MGCATSQPKVCQKCRAPYSPMSRSYSMHAHHPPQKEDYNYHLVALTSTTLGSLILDPLNQSQTIKDDEQSPFGNCDSDVVKNCKEEFAMGLIEAKTWSEMINEKIPKVIPKTPITTPPGEPEIINTWELMEGLEDISPFKPPNHVRSFSFHVSTNPNYDQPTKPFWPEITDDESNSNSTDTSIVSESEPEVISSFRKTLEDLPPTNPFYLNPVISEKQQLSADKDESLKLTTDVKKVKDKLVVYFTSLRGVRKTYEDCCHVLVILKGLGVKIDERDLSMDSGFKEELKELLGDKYNVGGLPKIFLGNKYIGGANEIRRMNEEGQLEKLVENCEMVEDCGGLNGGGNGGVCEACGDIRFVPCESCSGSCKIYYEAHCEDDDDEEEEFEEDEYGFKRCPDCNENGLIRCPMCCD